ncbi:MAG: hypothetical protein GDA41_00565 [Rhodospirillales bacterium]|nr:hypothetical protein [Rhodospirillales bacterium]
MSLISDSLTLGGSRANWLTIAKKWAIVEGEAFSLDALESLPREWSGEASRFFCTRD